MVNFNLWPGAGYFLTSFKVEEANENNLEEAFELLAKKLIEEDATKYFLTPEEFNTIYEDEEEGNDSYLYVDGTCSGAAYPVYICIENIQIN